MHTKVKEQNLVLHESDLSSRLERGGSKRTPNRLGWNPPLRNRLDWNAAGRNVGYYDVKATKY